MTSLASSRLESCHGVTKFMSRSFRDTLNNAQFVSIAESICTRSAECSPCYDLGDILTIRLGKTRNKDALDERHLEIPPRASIEKATSPIVRAPASIFTCREPPLELMCGSGVRTEVSPYSLQHSRNWCGYVTLDWIFDLIFGRCADSSLESVTHFGCSPPSLQTYQQVLSTSCLSLQLPSYTGSYVSSITLYR